VLPPREIDQLTWVRPDWRQAIVESVARLETALEGIRQRPFRRTLVRDAIRDLHPEPLVATLAIVMDRARQGHQKARAVVEELALEPTVFEEMPYTRVRAAYALAQAHGCDDVGRLFISAAQNNNPTVDEAFIGNEHMDAPVGIRRAAARQRDRFALDRLLHDRDWRVIENLLENPRLTEPDVVKIAAMRPTRPEILRVVAAHGRWSSCYAVRKALTLNPSTPAPIARRLLGTLMRQHLRLVIDSGRLDTDLREQAAGLLAQRPAQAGARGLYDAIIDLDESDPGELDALMATLNAEPGEAAPNEAVHEASTLVEDHA
jgi:hypothetical protein